MEITNKDGKFLGSGGVVEGDRVYKVTTQTEFEELFGDSYGGYYFNNDSSGSPSGITNGGDVCKIPENTTIILNPIQGTVDNSLTSGGAGIGDNGSNVYNGRPAYVLKNAIELSDNVTIKGFNEADIVVIKDDSLSAAQEDSIRFYNTHNGQDTSVTASGSTFTNVGDFTPNKGDLLHWAVDNSFYTVTNVVSTTVTVDRTPTAGTNTLSKMVTNVKMDGWSFDGRGGVHGLGGGVSGDDKDGGAFNIPYLGESKLNLKIINHKVVEVGSNGRGGAIYGNNTCYDITALNIYDCYAIYTGGVYGCDYSNFVITRCVSDTSGGAEFCDFSTIKVINCIGYSNGGGAHKCDYSEIKAINCSANSNGGGAYLCDYSKIIAINCSASSGIIAHSCDNCESIWGTSGDTIVSCTLGGVRLGQGVADTVTSNQVNTNGNYVD